MRYGYAKIGRSLHFNRAKHGPQGDPAAPNLIRRLAERNPEDTLVLVGKHDGAVADLPANVENPWQDGIPRTFMTNQKLVHPESLQFEEEVIVPLIGNLDGMVVDLGQHGTTHLIHPSLPKVKNTWTEFDADPSVATTPQDWSINYGHSLVRGINALGDRTSGQAPVVWLCEDSRNYLKARDIKWPTGTDDILAQHQLERGQLHERFRDTSAAPSALIEWERDGELWRAPHRYRHGGTDLMILDDEWPTFGHVPFSERGPAGVATSSFWNPKPHERRSALVKAYLLAAFPDAPIFGHWDVKCLEEVEEGQVLDNSVAEFYDLLASWRVTVTLPAASRSKHGAMWCCAKPWQAFAARTAAFMIGPTDAQGWILPSRRETPEARRVADGLWSVRTDWTEEELHLARWLRVEDPAEFAQRATVAALDVTTWEWIVGMQRDLLSRRWDERLLERTIEHKLRLRGQTVGQPHDPVEGSLGRAGV